MQFYYDIKERKILIDISYAAADCISAVPFVKEFFVCPALALFSLQPPQKMDRKWQKRPFVSVLCYQQLFSDLTLIRCPQKSVQEGHYMVTKSSLKPEEIF